MDRARINGNAYSYSSITAIIAGERYTGLTSIQYDDQRERTLVYGLGRDQSPQGMTGGKYNPGKPKLAGRKETMVAIRRALSAQASDGASYGNVSFDVQIQYVEDDQTPNEDFLFGCRVENITTSNASGPEATAEEWDLICMGLLRDGLPLYDATLREI